MSTILLIHAAYQGGWIWRSTAAALRDLGHDALCPTLDGCGERRHLLRAGITNESHARELAELAWFEDLCDVTLVGTSTGGMVACRLAELIRDRVAQIVFVDALALLDGERLSDIVTRRNAVTTDVGTGPSREDARGRLFAELDEATREWAVERCTPHPVAVMREPVHLESFWAQSWAARVIWCRHSQNPPREHQERAARALQAEWRELDAGHYPMLQCPHDLAKLIADDRGDGYGQVNE